VLALGVESGTVAASRRAVGRAGIGGGVRDCGGIEEATDRGGIGEGSSGGEAARPGIVIVQLGHCDKSKGLRMGNCNDL
jgi:hypothetical protein